MSVEDEIEEAKTTTKSEFTLSRTASGFEEKVAKTLDATPFCSWRQSLKLNGFNDLGTWKEAGVEGMSLGVMTPAILGALASVPLVSWFILTGGPVSGGHFNLFIVILTFTARLSSFPRTALYVVWQCAGAVVAGWLIRASLGAPKETFCAAGGRYIDSSLVTPAEAFTLETMTALSFIFISFGVGLDPRQRGVFGPALSPILVGFAYALCNFASGIARVGYSGASLDPARCLGLMATSENLEYHYIHWVGDITAAVINGFLYWMIPPYTCTK
ncbi:MIP transporter [Massarina eburnea CBS 473.64]|uniref:MIP transporter n=1 Tax=Massarina eburnea CBS 473.64 TaxID=1395130 RepID=A0A6A6S0T4_9PLEO|nr:MIP transporter [Massarina eburnea CBS 473.64]